MRINLQKAVPTPKVNENRSDKQAEAAHSTASSESTPDNTSKAS